MKSIRNFYRGDLPTGLKIILSCLVLGILCAAPIWLVGRFGPADAMPTGLALVAMFGTIGAAIGTAIGVFWLVLELIFRRR